MSSLSLVVAVRDERLSRPFISYYVKKIMCKGTSYEIILRVCPTGNVLDGEEYKIELVHRINFPHTNGLISVKKALKLLRGLLYVTFSYNNSNVFGLG